tara:strand:+ start:87 stop:764 length:678 start_codon:yes stop_codon:yes gene_type:complete
MPAGLGGKLNKNALGKAIKQEIINHSGCNRFPIKGEQWEEISVRALQSVGLNAEWKAGSHGSGADIWLANLNQGISNKSGKITRTKSTGKYELSISSYRTTKYKTLEEKLDFFDGDGKNFKNYLILTREEDENTRKYKVIFIDASKITAKKLKWSVKTGKTSKQTGWSGVNKNLGIKMNIVKSMSDQFWIYLDLNKFKGAETLAEVSIPMDKLGKTHMIVEAMPC